MSSNNKPSGGDEEKCDEKVEFKENDKWVENNEREKDGQDGELPQSRLDDLGKRAKRFASNKYNVIIVLLCILLFVFFIIVIALAAKLGSISCPEPNECRSADCLLAAASTVSRADYDADPCTDFYSYSCNGWLKKNPLPKNKGSYSVLDELRKNTNVRLRHLIDLVPYTAPASDPRVKVKNFYSSCVNLGEIDFWVPRKLKHAINEIGGWAVLKIPLSSQWKRNDVLKKLQVTYGVPLFFKITVGPDDTEPTKNIVKLIPDGLGLPNRKYYFKPQTDPYIKAYKEFIKNLMHELEVTLHEANMFADYIFHYEKRLAEITPEVEILQNSKENYVKLTVSELDKLSASISWTDILQTYFPGVIQPETEVAILSEKYFRDISKLISSTDNELLNDYYMWRLIYTYVPHLSSKYRLAANHFRQTFEGVEDLDLEYQERWEFCMELTSQYLGHAMGAMYVERYFTQESLDKMQLYVHKLVSALSRVTSNARWLEDSASEESAQSKIRSLSLLVGYPTFIRNRTLEMYYNELNVQVEYFQNIKEGVYFLHTKQAEMLRKPAISDLSWLIYPQDVISEYQYAGNKLIVPAGLLESPLFDFGSPLAVKYGVLSGHVANKLSHIFDKIGINYETYGVLTQWMSNSSLETYQQKADCLKNGLVMHSFHDVNVDPSLTLNNYMSSIGGVKIAYEAYKKHVKESGSEGVLPGMDLNNDQLFFISYAQSLCEAVRPDKLKAIRDSNEVLPKQIRVHATLQQLPEFSSAFSCAKNTAMNSATKCHMW